MRRHELEPNPQPQPDGRPVVHVVLSDAAAQPAETRIGKNIINFVYKQRIPGVGIDAKPEVAKQGKVAASPAGPLIRRKQRMIEDVVHVGPELRGHALAKVKVLVYAEVQCPGPEPPP